MCTTFNVVWFNGHCACCFLGSSLSNLDLVFLLCPASSICLDRLLISWFNFFCWLNKERQKSWKVVNEKEDRMCQLQNQTVYPPSSISGCFLIEELMKEISSSSTSLLQIGHFLISGNSNLMTHPKLSISSLRCMNQSRYTQMRWNLWKHVLILTKSLRSAKLCYSFSSSWASQNCSKHTAHLPLTVSL